MEGLLLVDKPKGWTSFDVVNYVRRIVAQIEGKKPRNVKVGHTGTLDPAATGLLVLCIGKYTKKVPELIRHDKTYIADLKFGYTSSTGDSEGTIEQWAGSKEQGKGAVVNVLQQFVGEIKQIPPAFSALKVNGKRAYELAREGKEVKLEPRTAIIHSIDLLQFAWPSAQIRCHVGSGTYIRTLAEDIGVQLGAGAYLTDLRRTEVDIWNVDDAIEPKMISLENLSDRLLLLED